MYVYNGIYVLWTVKVQCLTDAKPLTIKAHVFKLNRKLNRFKTKSF